MKNAKMKTVAEAIGFLLVFFGLLGTYNFFQAETARIWQEFFPELAYFGPFILVAGFVLLFGKTSEGNNKTLILPITTLLLGLVMKAAGNSPWVVWGGGEEDGILGTATFLFLSLPGLFLVVAGGALLLIGVIERLALRSHEEADV